MHKIFLKKSLVIVIILLISSILSPLFTADNISQKEVIINNEEHIGFYTLIPTDDTYIRMRDPDNNYGAKTLLQVRNRYGASVHPYYWEHDTLVKFDLTKINSKKVQRATLNLYYYEYADNNPKGRILNLYRVLEDWNEDTVTWNLKPMTAESPICGAVVPDSYGQWMTWDVTSEVNDILDGSVENYGWQIMDDVPFNTVNIPNARFYSKEYGDFIPNLEIIQFSKAFVTGKIQNLDATGDFIKVNAYNLRCLCFSPFGLYHFSSGEPILIDKSSRIGILTTSFMFGLFNIAI